MIVNAWVRFSLGGYVDVLFIFVYVSALFKTSSDFWMHKGSSQLSSFPSARSPLDTEGAWLPQRLQALFLWIKSWDRTEWDSSSLTARSTLGRDCWHTQAPLGLVQDQSSQITQGPGSLVLKSIPSPALQGSGAFIWACLFYPFINTCFLFLTKYVWQTQLGQIYSRSNLDNV